MVGTDESNVLNNVEGFANLHPKEKELFYRTYKRHFTAHGNEEKKRHTVDKITKIKPNYKELCIEVYFKHEFYKYYPNLTWG